MPLVLELELSVCLKCDAEGRDASGRSLASCRTKEVGRTGISFFSRGNDRLRRYFNRVKYRILILKETLNTH